ncbi:MAG: acyltransferase [Bacteroidales bacterium]|nr:acyltransferase [Bacteroidales bacterium]
MNANFKEYIRNNWLLFIAAKRLQRIKQKWKLPILGKNNKIINKGVLLNVKYDIVGNNNLIEIGERAVLSDMKIFIRGNNHKLTIKEDCRYKGGIVWFEDNNCQITIGRNTGIVSAHLAVTEPNRKITIGEDCMFSTNIEFRTGDSHSIIDMETKKRINASQDITVEDHVWIGANSIILKGAHIENNSIIGTNSLVTKRIPSHSIAAGIPAKVIKNNIDWLRERTYE